MGWEERGGRSYYYEKRRDGDTVRSEYVGSGPVAALCEEYNEIERQARRGARELERLERDALLAEARAVDSIMDQIRQLTHASMIAAGYRMHKGQWRKRRAPAREA